MESKININFLDKKDAAKELSTKDDFINSLSGFDIAVRMKSNSYNSINEFIDFISSQTLEWKNSEIRTIEHLFNNLKTELQNYYINLPEEIKLMKTTGKEEGDAAYCRDNAIIFPRMLFENINILEQTLIHELFHIISRNNPKKKKSLYNIIGFQKCPILDFPKELIDLKITNPDAPLNNYYIKLIVKGTYLNMMPILFSERYYDTIHNGSIFDYLQCKLLAINITETQSLPKYMNNKLILINPYEFSPYLEKIGSNTDYIIHPEEILADNFVLVIKNKDIVEKDLILSKMVLILKKN